MNSQKIKMSQIILKVKKFHFMMNFPAHISLILLLHLQQLILKNLIIIPISP